MRGPSDESMQAICLNNIGSLYVEEGNYGDALTYFQRSLDLQQKLKVPSDIARSLNNLGETYRKLGKFDSALDNYLKALEVARSAGEKSLVALTSDGMARLFELQGRNGADIGAIPQRSKKKDDTGNLGLEELLEGGDESTGHKRKSTTGARPIANTSMPVPTKNQTSGRMAAMVERKGFKWRALGPETYSAHSHHAAQSVERTK